jgi:hypothetical protein
VAAARFAIARTCNLGLSQRGQPAERVFDAGLCHVQAAARRTLLRR